MDESYQPPIYTPPSIVTNIGSFLSVPRKSYSTDFVDVASPDEELQLSYARGLFVLAVTFMVVNMLWSLILIILKFSGESVGCASGRAFRSKRLNDSEADLVMPSDTTDEDSYALGDSEPSPTSSLNVQMFVNDRAVNSSHSEVGASDLVLYETNNQQQHQSSEHGMECELEHWEPFSTTTQNCAKSTFYHPRATPERVAQRRKRTIYAFYFFSIATIIMAPLILSNSYRTMKKAAQSTDDVIQDTRDVVSKINGTLNIVTDAARVSEVVVQETPLDFAIICPNIAEDDLEEVLNVNPKDIVRFMDTEFQPLQDFVANNVSTVIEIMHEIDNSLADTNDSVQNMEGFLWVLPFTLISSLFLTIICMLAVKLSHRFGSQRGFQRFMNLIILPLMMLFCTFCWVLVIGSSIGAAVTHDVCTGGPSPGSPDYTIRAVMDAHEIHPESVAYKLVVAYTSGCQTQDPTSLLLELGILVDEKVELIKYHLEQVDIVGLDEINRQCGGDDELDNFYTGIGKLALELSSVGFALEEAGNTLQCSEINPLYARAFHESLCTDLASSMANSFLLFLLVSTSMMVLLTLRASWREF